MGNRFCGLHMVQFELTRAVVMKIALYKKEKQSDWRDHAIKSGK